MREYQEDFKLLPVFPLLNSLPGSSLKKKKIWLKAKQSVSFLLRGHNVPTARLLCHIAPTPTNHFLNSPADVFEETERLCA